KADGARTIMITTDGVFSMDGFVAPLDEITALADRYGALVHIDECHATGFVGETGRGSAEVKGVLDRIDIITGTLGKAMGGALGGFTTGKAEVIELLRQRSRPYLFSNSLPPHVVAAGIRAFEMLASADELRQRLRENTAYFRERMSAAGFDLRVFGGGAGAGRVAAPCRGPRALLLRRGLGGAGLGGRLLLRVGIDAATGAVAVGLQPRVEIVGRHAPAVLGHVEPVRRVVEFGLLHVAGRGGGRGGGRGQAAAAF